MFKHCLCKQWPDCNGRHPGTPLSEVTVVQSVGRDNNQREAAFNRVVQGPVNE